MSTKEQRRPAFEQAAIERMKQFPRSDPFDMPAPGARSRLTDPFGGDKLDVIRRRPAHGVAVHPGTRFCEACQCRKPHGKTRAVKGWKCADCKVKKVDGGSLA